MRRTWTFAARGTLLRMRISSIYLVRTFSSPRENLLTRDFGIFVSSSYAELAANGVVECASGRALRSTAAAWDKRETIAW